MESQHLPEAAPSTAPEPRGPGLTLHSQGTFGLGERRIFSIAVDRIEDLQALPPLPTPAFVCFVAMDARGVDDQRIRGMAHMLISRGCTYICVWGQDCERVHDLFDLVDYERRPEGPWCMSTWHSNDPLSGGLWFALHAAWPDPACEDQPHAMVAVSVGSRRWARWVHAILSRGGVFPRRASALWPRWLSRLACRWDQAAK